MEIWHIGHSCFKIKGKNAIIVTDPFDPKMIGLKFPSLDADIVTISHDHKDHNYTANINGSPIILNAPGEYEIKGVKIRGIKSFHDNNNGINLGKNIIFEISIDGINILHLGDLGHKLETDRVSNIKTPDILFIPIGGEYTLDAKQAYEVTTKLEPSIVIPMHYKDERGSKEVFEKIGELSAFTKLFGEKPILSQPKLTISKDKIPQEMQIVTLV